MSASSARASRKWIWLGAGVAVAATGYLLYYGPGRKAVFEAKQPASPAQALAAPDALDSNAFRSFKLSNIKKYSHNTNIFTFAFDDPKPNIMEKQLHVWYSKLISMGKRSFDHIHQ